MLGVLVPWFYNLELVDPNVVTANSEASTLSSNGTGLGFLPLQTGYGSVEGTQIILNNLFYLTCKFSDEYAAEFELLWAVLVSTWKSNLKIACRFLFIMTSLASYEMLVHVKRVVCYLSKTCPERLIDELVVELECMDSFVSILDKCENVLPFYRYNKPAPVTPSPLPQSQATVENKKNSKKAGKSRTYFVNRTEDDEENEAGVSTDSNVFLNNDENSDDEDNSDDDDDDDDEDDDEEEEEDEDDEDDEDEDYFQDENEDSSDYEETWVYKIPTLI